MSLLDPRSFRSTLSIDNELAKMDSLSPLATNNSILALTRLRTNCYLRGNQRGKWEGVVIIDSGAPITAIDQRILRGMNEKPTGEYFPGTTGGVRVPPGNSVYQIYVKTSVSPETLMKVYASVNPFPEAQVLLGLDWLQIADPDIDWSSGTITAGSSGGAPNPAGGIGGEAFGPVASGSSGSISIPNGRFKVGFMFIIVFAAYSSL